MVLSRMLAERGHDVVGLDTDLYERCTFGPPTATAPTIKKDIRDITQADLVGFDAIAHLAGLSNDPLGDLDPGLTDEINHVASVRLAYLAKATGVQRFVFSSSCSNYGAAGDELLNESSEFNPVTPYGRSKVDVERAVATIADDRFSPTFLRSATAYGVSPRLRFDLVLNNLVAWAFATGRIYLKSDGTPWRPVVHIEDISRAFCAALEAPVEIVRNQAFNVGRTQENYRIRELAEIVRSTVPRCSIEFAPDAGPDKRCYRVDCSKAENTLPGYQPQWDAKRGAQELYQAYLNSDITVDDFEGPRFKRIGHIRELISTGVIDERLRRRSSAAATVAHSSVGAGRL